jgi:LacI family transcriptional regulator
MQERSWTIYDIAREAEVSAKTVSRVLNKKPGVSEETRRRVLEIMERVAYHPHIGARTLRGRHNGCIGVTLPAPMNVVPVSQNVFVWLFAHLHEVFGRHGDYIGFDLNPHAASPRGDYGRGVWEQLFKAVVVAGPLPLNDPVIERIHESKVPYVAMGRLESLPELSSATVDYEEAAYLSTQFLIGRGHRRIAMLRAFEGFHPGVERWRGYMRALDEAGIAPDESLIRSVDFGVRSIANVIHRLLSDPSVTALVDSSATEDGDALREGARRAGRTPGKDFEIVTWTYNDHGTVLAEASAHVFLPVLESIAEGIEKLAAWTEDQRRGPIQLLYHAVLRTEADGSEMPRPKRLFDSIA